jgi:fluoroquinolone resistance protein
MEDIVGSKKEFYGQNFSDVSLCKEQVAGKEFDNCSFESCDFSEAVFRGCEFTSCKFEKCNLAVLSVLNSKFSDVEFDQCKMLAIDWTKAYWRGLALSAPLKFQGCLISSSSFYGLNLPKIVIEDCRAQDVDFREANFSGADFSRTDLSNSLFANTNLTEANFNEAVNYDIDVNNNLLKGARFCRFEAVRLLDSLGVHLID